jgi:ENTS family enterobactin (siderophore) exporter
MHESIAFVVRQPTVGWAMFLSLIGNLLGRSFQPLFPAFVHDALRGDARELSFVMTAAGIGALTGAFGTASLGSLRRRGVVFACSGIALGGMLTLFGLQSSIIPAIVLAYAVAACSQLFITMATTLYNTHTPDALRGRVMGLSTIVVQGGISMGAMLVGSLGAAIGIGAALSMSGGVFAASAATVLARVRALRDETIDEESGHAGAMAARLVPSGRQ